MARSLDIAFYAPMKPPDHPVPSGDRYMARMLMAALETAGHRVTLASRLRTWDGDGDPMSQQDCKEQGEAEADRLIEAWRRSGATPDLWFTYHLYYKATDWIGPRVCAALGAPYVVAEASVAYKRVGGPWDLGHKQTLAALSRAALIVTVNPKDAERLPEPDKSRLLPPFLDAGRFAEPQEKSNDPPVLVAPAMMRHGDKLASYRLLADALSQIQEIPWTLRIYGDGPARGEVEEAFAGFPEGKVEFCGAAEEEALPELLAACDLCVWPAVNEAYGMALLEAEGAGVPVVAGRSLGVPSVVAEGETGMLVEPNDAAAFAAAVRELLEDPARRAEMGRAAAEKVRRDHGLEAAARTLNSYIQDILPE